MNLSLRWLMLPLAVALASACGPASSTPVTGTVTLSQPLGAADATSADYELSAQDISSALNGALTVNAGRAEGTVADVPAGANRTMTVRAYTGTVPNRVQVCSGTPSVEVSGGATSTANPLRPRSDSLGDISVAATFEATRAPGTASATASGAGIAAPIVVPLSSGGGPLSVTIRNVPAGANRWTQADTTGRGDGFNAAHLGRLTIN